MPSFFGNWVYPVMVTVGVIAVSGLMTRVAVKFVGHTMEKNRDVLPPTSLFKNLTRVAIYGLGGLVILQSLGISITPVLTALGVGGLAVALALQPTLENIFAGLQIILSRQFKLGDYVKLSSGEEGYVQDITWRNTTIRALSNHVIIAPNASLATALLTNYSQPDREIAVLVPVGVAYGSDLENVERVTVAVGKEVLQEVEGGVGHFEPFIRYHTFSDSSINFTMILRCQEFVHQFLVKHEFVKRLHKAYKIEGIEIPFPIRTVHLKQG